MLKTKVNSSIVARRHQQVSEDSQLVLCQPLLVLGPIVLMRPFELLEDILDGGGDGLGVMEMVSQDHEDGGQVVRNVVGT